MELCLASLAEHSSGKQTMDLSRDQWSLSRRAVARKMTCSTGKGDCKITLQVSFVFGLEAFPSNPCP